MRYVGDLITEARAQANNTIYSATEGVSQENALLWIQRGQENIQGSILRNIQPCTLFDDTFTFTTVASQRPYGLPGDSTYAGTPSYARRPVYSQAVHMIEYTHTGRDRDYWPLQLKDLHELTRFETTPIDKYALQNGKILLSPVPNVSGKTLKVTYAARLDDLDFRRGKVTSVTKVGSYLTTIVLDSSPTPDTLLSDTNYWISVCDVFGTIHQNCILIDSYNSGTRTLTVHTGTTSLDTIVAGDYVTLGKWSTTHSALPEECECYLVAYLVWKFFKYDSSDDVTSAAQELLESEKDAIDNLRGINRDAQELPVLDTSWLW